ncbi:MAG: serine O-acetyltransferase [Alphaproteobacteria bacterium]
MTFREEIRGIMARDPAARSWVEIVICYPGFHALMFHRASSWLWRRHARLFARALSQFARMITGIEIHPGAKIGRGFFVDHGMGVVVGETAEIGENVTLYHDVTQILGPITVGACARIGANAVVTKDVPPNATVVGIPGRAIVRVKGAAGDEFAPYGTPLGDLPDPVARALEGLMDQVTGLKARVEELESQVEDIETTCSPTALLQKAETRNAGPENG